VGEQEDVLKHLVAEVLGWTWVTVLTDDAGAFVDLGDGRRLVAFRREEPASWGLGLLDSAGELNLVSEDF